MEYSIAKSNVECYKMRLVKGGSLYWADITIDASGTTGRIQIASDYGSWQYYWGACGKPFKQFLLSLNMSYMADKFGADKHFDPDATIRAFKEQVIEYRRQENITAENARTIYKEIILLTHCVFENDFIRVLSDCDELMLFFDYMPPIQRDYHPLFKRFWEDCWPAFCEQLKRETELIPTKQ